MKKHLVLSLLLICIALTVQETEAQVVPYGVTGTVAGNLATGEATGEAVGLHFGQLTFEIDSSGLDVQTAADGSELWLVRGATLVLEFIPVEGGLFEVFLVEEWFIIGGTGRFANAKSSGEPIISTAYTEPFDLSNPVGSAVFDKAGEIDLGRRGN